MINNHCDPWCHYFHVLDHCHYCCQGLKVYNNAMYDIRHNLISFQVLFVHAFDAFTESLLAVLHYSHIESLVTFSKFWRFIFPPPLPGKTLCIYAKWPLQDLGHTCTETVGELCDHNSPAWVNFVDLLFGIQWHVISAYGTITQHTLLAQPYIYIYDIWVKCARWQRQWEHHLLQLLTNGRESVSWPPTSQNWSHSFVHGHPCIHNAY